MLNRRSFIRGILGSVLAAPFVGIAKAAGIKPKPQYILGLDMSGGPTSFTAVSMWEKRADGLWHCLFSKRLEVSPPTDWDKYFKPINAIIRSY